MGEKNYWLHRISYEGDISRKLLDKGYLSIGWQHTVGSDMISLVHQPDMTAFDKIIINHDKSLPRNRYGLWRFLKFKPDDVVVVPLPEGKFSIYKVIGSPIEISKLPISAIPTNLEFKDGFLYSKGKIESVDIGYVVQVVPIKENLLRASNASAALVARMKIRQTNADIGDLAPLISAYEEGAVFDIGKECEAFQDAIAKNILNFIQKNLSPNSFEQLVAYYFKKLGAATSIPAKNESNKDDGADADVIAVFDTLKVTYYIQVKLHTNDSNEDAVKQISKYVNQREDYPAEVDDHENYSNIAWVISTCDNFTKECKELAKNKVVLVNGLEFANALAKTDTSDLFSIFISNK